MLFSFFVTPFNIFGISSGTKIIEEPDDEITRKPYALDITDPLVLGSNAFKGAIFIFILESIENSLSFKTKPLPAK